VVGSGVAVTLLTEMTKARLNELTVIVLDNMCAHVRRNGDD
jgi:hypothetical protein